MNRSKRKKLDAVLTYVILIILAAFIVVPVLWMLSTAFKTEATTNARTIIWHQFCFLLFFKLLKVLLDTELGVS